MAEAAAITAGFKWLAPLATDLFKKGYSYLGLDVEVDEKLLDLKNNIIPQMVILIKAAENSPYRDDLHDWLKSLEEAVYEAEDVLDEHDYYLLEQKVKSNAGGIKVRLESLPPIKYLSKKFNIKLKKSLEKLEKTAVKAKEILPLLSIGMASNLGESQTTNESRRMVTTSLLAHKVFGRDKQRNDIVRLLHETAGLSVENPFSVVAIVGVGGSGKTTLAQYVYDYEEKADAKYFDVIMWVHVSQIFDVQKLTKKMVESASGKKCPDFDNLDTLQRELQRYIKSEESEESSKRFLLILDDVWNEREVTEMQWKQLLAPLSAGKIGSKILMTTRQKGVAETLCARNILYLAELEKEDFLSLFTYYAFAFGDNIIVEDKLYKELKEIVKENAPKLHGSPLAATMVGGQLRKIPEVKFWKKTLSGELLEDTRKSLLWSYQNLDAPLQRCFSYCSLFLKGDKIEREELIHMWIAEGFIKPTDDSNRIEDVGQDYFDDLLSSSFFQPTKTDDLYTMHDLLHDLAETVSKDRCLRVEGNLTNTIPQEIRHLSLHHINGHTLSDLVEKICNLKNLRTLIIFMWTSDDPIHIPHSIFVKLKKLRVVHLEIYGLQNLPESIGGLKHLRYLYFYGSSSLPISIYTLYHLEFLYIPNSDECRLEAKALANWINLQHLYFNSMILNVVGINCRKQLGNQRKFHGDSIQIYGLENVKEKREVTMDIYNERLRLVWSITNNNSRSLDMDVQVLESFRLTPELDDLTIVGYRGCVLPSWMECLTMLNRLTIDSCWFLTSLGGLQALRSLRILVICFCPNLSAEGGNTSVLPSSLEQLEIVACHWKNLDDSQPDLTSSIDSKSSDKIPFTASLQLGHLKLLRKLSITNCPNIGSLLGLQELNKLEYLTLMGCPKLAQAETKLGSLKKKFKTDAPSLLYMLFSEEAIASLPELYIKKFKKESFRSEEERVFQHLTSLETLCFENCSIKSLPNNLETLSTLTSLDIDDCPNIKSLPDLPRSLETLSFKNCSIKSLPNNLETLSTLTTLYINGCPNIKSLPDLPRSLTRINLTNCNWVLKRRCQEPHGKDWPKIARIPDVSISLPEYGGCFPWLVVLMWWRREMPLSTNRLWMESSGRNNRNTINYWVEG